MIKGRRKILFVILAICMIVATVTVGSGRAYDVNQEDGTETASVHTHKAHDSVILASDGKGQDVYGSLGYSVSDEVTEAGHSGATEATEQRLMAESGVEYEADDASKDNGFQSDDEAGDETEAEVSDTAATVDDRTEAEKLLDSMTNEEKVAQLFIVTPDQLTGATGVTLAGETTKAAIDERPVGGIIYMGDNLIDSAQVKEMLSNTYTYSQERIGLPMLLCVDEEGGTVARIAGSGRFGVDNVGNMSTIGETGTTEDAHAAGVTIGTYMAELGFNVNFAPVADVLTNPDNSIVKYRSFGSDVSIVSDMAIAVAEGLREQGIEATFKHFPGHGATAGDTHLGAAFTTKTKEELMKEELIPFQKAIDYGAKFMMVSHISVPNITGHDTPASLSPEMIDGILRSDMGYKGVVITDAMEMGAISSKYTSDTAAVMAIQAGADMLLTPEDFDLAYQGVLDAVESGEISEERLDESVLRIIEAKQEM